VLSTSEELTESVAGAPGFHFACCQLCKTSGNMKILLEEPEKRLLRCKCCQVAFLDPQPTLEALTDDFVDRHIDSEARLEASFTTNRDPVLRITSNRIANQAQPSPATILDVGCAGGYFLDRFFPGSQWQKFGAEPSRFASQAAAKKGITVWQGMFASLDLPAAFFDVVTVLDALYYFREPAQELRLIRKVLKPSGALWIEVPLGEAQIWRNNSAVARVFSGSARSLFASNHLFYYNLPSLSYLLKETGFRVVEAIPLPPIRHPNFYANILYRSFYGASRLVWTLSIHRFHFGPNVLVKAVPR
jgi:SAM-dependent methyltransferase